MDFTSNGNRTANRSLGDLLLASKKQLARDAKKYARRLKCATPAQKVQLARQRARLEERESGIHRAAECHNSRDDADGTITLPPRIFGSRSELSAWQLENLKRRLDLAKSGL